MSVGSDLSCKLVDGLDLPAAQYLRNTVVSRGMTDNERAAAEQQGVAFPPVTEEYRARIERLLLASATPWTAVKPSWP